MMVESKLIYLQLICGNIIPFFIIVLLICDKNTSHSKNIIFPNLGNYKQIIEHNELTYYTKTHNRIRSRFSRYLESCVLTWDCKCLFCW